MRVLGLDPGTARTGYGAVEYLHGKLRLLNYGVITTTPDLDMPKRLLLINQELSALIDAIQPDAVAVEQIYYHKNAKTVITVAQSRGVALLTGAQAGRLIAEYTPLQVKQAVVGYGNADKKQVQYMVQKLLSLKEIPQPDDAADALAAAICHVHFHRLAGLYKG
ncbi:MAG: crossover junction endodeoxyribonuclease RuvC [Syntrophomonadaceae bacterium]